MFRNYQVDRWSVFRRLKAFKLILEPLATTEVHSRGLCVISIFSKSLTQFKDSLYSAPSDRPSAGVVL